MAPASSSNKKAKKAPRAPSGSRKITNLQTFIHRTHKRLHSDLEQRLGIADGAMRTVNLILVHNLQALCAQALKTASFHKKGTLRAKHVKAATLVMTPPEFSAPTVAFADKVVDGGNPEPVAVEA